jgi:predicted transcriptional regulator
MNEYSFIYGRTESATGEKVLVKMYVPKRLKTALDTLKLVSGRKLQDIAAEAIEQYVNRELAMQTAKRATTAAVTA